MRYIYNVLLQRRVIKLTIDFVALDLETTGLNSSTDAITEIGAAKFNYQGEKI